MMDQSSYTKNIMYMNRNFSLLKKDDGAEILRKGCMYYKNDITKSSERTFCTTNRSTVLNAFHQGRVHIMGRSPVKLFAPTITTTATEVHPLTRRVAHYERYFPTRKFVRSIKALMIEADIDRYHDF